METTRRCFAKTAVLGGACWLARPGAAADAAPFEAHVPFRALTEGPESHWFGYYDKQQYDESGRYALGARVGFDNRSPKPDDAIRLGMVDRYADNQWIELGETSAWCWQQGCMFQWIPGRPGEVIFNTRVGDGYGSAVMNVHTGKTHAVSRPIYALSPDGRHAVSANFARLGVTRPGYGYNGPPDPWHGEPHPANDGIYLVDIESDNSKLAVPLDRIAKFQPDETMRGAKHWFNHLLFNPDGSRFIFLHRWERTVNGRRSWFTRMFTADPEGENLHCVADHQMVSHFIWKSPRRILAWSREPATGDRFHLYYDMSQHAQVVGEGILTRDGHCTYSPDGEWILVDTYPDSERMQHLMLYRPADKRLVKLGKFYQSPEHKGEIRCDLHPRWSPDGRTVCIDSLHSGQRQMYELDVSGYTG